MDDMNEDVVLGSNFLHQVSPYFFNHSKQMFICTFDNKYVRLPLSFRNFPICPLPEQSVVQLANPAQLMKMERSKIFSELHGEKALSEITEKLRRDCCSDSPNAFWTREKYFVSLPYDPNQKIKPMKASAALMSPSEVKFCDEEIQELLQKGLIEPAKSPWACRAFVVNKHSEQKRGKPRLVVNFKPLNAVLQKIRYPLPNKSSLLQRINGCVIFSKFDLKSGFYQIGIKAEDRFKTTFLVPRGQYQWKVLPFGINNAPSEFQKCMEDIFREYSWALVYIDDILICSHSL